MKGLNLKDLNTKVNPADDFFEFANGGWIKHNPIPATENRWGSFYELYERNRKNLLGLLKDLTKKKWKKGSDHQKLRDFFSAAMDEKSINAAGMRPLVKELQRIDTMRTTEDLIATTAHLHALSVDVLWNPNVEVDDKNSSRYILRFYQHGLGLPDRDYYFKTDKKSRKIRKAYEGHVQNILILTGYSKKEAVNAAKKVLELETCLARASLTNVECRDVHRIYNKFSFTKLARMAPDIPWKSYFTSIGVPRVRDLLISQPKFIEEINKMVKDVSLDAWKHYFRFHLVAGFSPHLSKKFVVETFHFYATILNGVKKLRPRWKRAVAYADEYLGEMLGKLYVEKYFPLHAKKRMDQLILNLRAAYAARIKNLDWMSAGTKKKALKKLSTIVAKVGYPTKWRDYRKYQVGESSHGQNIINGEIFEFKRMIAKLGKPIDRTEWFMSPPTVNAYYDPPMNEIAFPAGILQPPYFSDTADDALNYGAIGAVIGHELTHGFDDQGSHYDEKGNMRNWWTKIDRKQFNKKAAVIARQFDQYKIVGGLRVNGKLTLGENIADLGGLVIAFDAFKKATKGKTLSKIDGLTPEQRFFVGFAISERGAYRPEALREQVLTNPHSPAYFRVNGPVSNMPEFYDVYGVKPGDKLYRSPSQRAKIW